MEKLTSLAALRAGDLDKIQKLEAELERAATHRHSYEEKGRRYRDTVEEVRTVPRGESTLLSLQRRQMLLVPQ